MRFILSLGAFIGLVVPAFAQGPLDEEGRLVQFQRDIAPILRTRCLECHGPEQAKNDFRVDDRDLVLGYLAPEEPEYSTMYADYMVVDDEAMLMPPPSNGGPLSTAELALVRTWIAEGAEWPEGVELVPDEPEPDAAADATSEDPAASSEPPSNASETSDEAPATLPARVWAFQGFFHPAVVHFPIALLSVGGLFVVLSFFRPAAGTEIAFACLMLGAISAVIASLMGWSFALEQGYGGWGRGADAAVFWHRWSGVVVSALAVALALLAAFARAKPTSRLNYAWKGGLLVCAVLVGWVGHQGGELTYGKNLYQRAFTKLRGGVESVAEPMEEAVEDAEQAVKKAIDE